MNAYPHESNIHFGTSEERLLEVLGRLKAAGFQVRISQMAVLLHSSDEHKRMLTLIKQSNEEYAWDQVLRTI